jgi:hypothetical protein
MLIEAWARDGLTLEQISDNLDVAVSTLCEYQNKYPEFAEALKNGREVIDVMVENALLKAALGYNYTEEELNKITGEPIELRKVAHPNTTALIFWLKNRKPREWRDKQELEHSGEAGVRIINDIPRPGTKG